MPRLSVWIIRTALVHLGLGFTCGAVMLFQKGVPLEATLLRLLPMHIEFVLIGWTMQLAIGVAFWILPRFARGPARGNESLGWAAYVLLNAGVLAAGIGAWLQVSDVIPLLGRGAEWLAVLAFALHAWPRVKPLGV